MSKSILVVDDEPELLSVIVDALTFAGYEVTQAKDGQQAWEILNNETPSIILSDYMMPRMNGCELFDLVRDSKKGKNTPFIFMSSTPELIRSIGKFAVLRKPFQFDVLMSKLNSVTC